jgi:hypothetical protein
VSRWLYGFEGGEAVEPLAYMEGVFLEEFEGDEGEGGGDDEGALAGDVDVELLDAGDEEVPGLEEVGEGDEEGALAGGFEGDEAGHAVGVEAGRDEAGQGLPAEGDDEEGGHVDLVEPLVEGLVVFDAAEVEEVHHEQVAEVDEQREDGAPEGPAQDGK